MSVGTIRPFGQVIFLIWAVFCAGVSQGQQAAHLASVRPIDGLRIPSSISVDQGGAPVAEAEIRQLARQAYVWAWPMVHLHNCRNMLGNLPAPGRMGGTPVAPPNH